MSSKIEFIRVPSDPSLSHSYDLPSSHTLPYFLFPVKTILTVRHFILYTLINFRILTTTSIREIFMAIDTATNVIAIEYSHNGLPLAIQGEKLSVQRFQVVDEKQISKIIREMSPTAKVIIDTEAFHGHGSLTARKYAQAIRAMHDGKPSVLFLRYGTPSDDIIENDKLAGATDVLYHSALTGAIDTRRMNHFIREGVLPPPPEKKRPPGNAADLINALNRRANDESGSADNDEEIPLPDSREKPPSIARSGSVRTAHQKPPPASKSFLQRITAPTEPEAPTLGDQKMEALLIELRAMNKQNAQILATLEGIRDSIRNLRAEKVSALLAEAQKKVTDVFAQLQGGNDVHPTEIPASVSTTPSTAPPPGAEEIPASTPRETPPIAIPTKGEPFMTNVCLFGKTVALQHLSSELFIHLVNTGETMGTADIAALYKLGRQGSYARMSKLLAGLDAFRKGLSSCLTLVQSGNSKNYRFDEEAFCKVMRVK